MDDSSIVFIFLSLLLHCIYIVLVAQYSFLHKQTNGSNSLFFQALAFNRRIGDGYNFRSFCWRVSVSLNWILVDCFKYLTFRYFHWQLLHYCRFKSDRYSGMCCLPISVFRCLLPMLLDFSSPVRRLWAKVFPMAFQHTILLIPFFMTKIVVAHFNHIRHFNTDFPYP